MMAWSSAISSRIGCEVAEVGEFDEVDELDKSDESDKSDKFDAVRSIVDSMMMEARGSLLWCRKSTMAYAARLATAAAAGYRRALIYG
jgi:hypothetical protein